MPNPLILYQQTRFTNVSGLVKHLAERMDEETLHQLRVELKRVRFIKNILCDYVEESTIDKAYKPFRELFKQLGKIRGQHVNIYRLNTVLNNSNEQTIQKKFENKKQKLEQHLQHFIDQNAYGLQKSMDRFILLASQINTWNNDEYVRSLKKQVKRKINQRTPKKRLHHGRHLLKAVLYSTELSSGVAAKINSIFNISVVADLEDAIGDWHDLSLLLKQKSARLLKQKTKRKIKEKKHQELKRVRQQIPKLFSSEEKLL